MGKVAGRPLPKQAPIGNPVPLLFVSDFEASLKLYTEQLGFHLEWRLDLPDDEYASIVRGATNFHITLCHCEGNVHVGRLDVRIHAPEIDRLYAEFDSDKIRLSSPPEEKPWGVIEFELEDPDGNSITFFDFPQ